MDDGQLEPTPAVRPAAHPEVVRLRRRHRLLGTLVVVTAVAGPLAGAAIERRAADDEPVETASDGAPSEPTTTDDDAGRSVRMEGAPADTAMASGGSMSLGPAPGYHPGAELEWLGAGSTGGVDVRLLLTDYGPQDDGNPFWEAPPGCYPTGSYSIQASAPRFAAVVGMERFGWPDRPDGTVQLVGVPEGDPRWIVVAAVDPAGATVAFPDGQSAPATDIGGMAVAAAPAPGWEGVEQGEQGFTATVESGGSTSEVVSWSYPSEEFLRESCTPPPPSLPDPGEQPADPAAATEAVRAALTTVFGETDPAAKAAVVEHPDVIIEAMEAVQQNYPDITSSATMGDLVFTDPTVAFFYFDLDTSIGTRFDDEIGEARLIDGAWVITTETICAQLRKGGATCVPPA